MTVQELDEIRAASAQAAAELLDAAELQPGQVLVVGCSSSEILGGQIGKYSSMDAAGAVYQGIAPVAAQRGVWLAAQCCEHLNRAIVLEREAAQRYGWEEVSVVPWPHAGAAGPPPAGRILPTRWRWRRSRPMQAWTSAAR